MKRALADCTDDMNQTLTSYIEGAFEFNLKVNCFQFLIAPGCSIGLISSKVLSERVWPHVFIQILA